MDVGLGLLRQTLRVTSALLYKLPLPLFVDLDAASNRLQGCGRGLGLPTFFSSHLLSPCSVSQHGHRSPPQSHTGSDAQWHKPECHTAASTVIQNAGFQPCPGLAECTTRGGTSLALVLKVRRHTARSRDTTPSSCPLGGWCGSDAGACRSPGKE